MNGLPVCHLKMEDQAIESCLVLLVMVGDDCKPRGLQHLFETYSIYWNNSSLSMITVQCLQYSVEILINELDDKLLLFLLYANDNYKCLHCYTFRRMLDPFSDLNFKSIHSFVQSGYGLCAVFKGLTFLCHRCFCFSPWVKTLLFFIFLSTNILSLSVEGAHFLCFSQVNSLLQHNKN